jgi:hypothetical protein
MKIIFEKEDIEQLVRARVEELLDNVTMGPCPLTISYSNTAYDKDVTVTISSKEKNEDHL